MKTKIVALPCGCSIQINITTFNTGQRGVSCSRHERSFIVGAVLPKEPDHIVTGEIAYVNQDQS